MSNNFSLCHVQLQISKSSPLKEKIYTIRFQENWNVIFPSSLCRMTTKKKCYILLDYTSHFNELCSFATFIENAYVTGESFGLLTDDGVIFHHSKLSFWHVHHENPLRCQVSICITHLLRETYMKSNWMHNKYLLEICESS